MSAINSHSEIPRMFGSLEECQDWPSLLFNDSVGDKSIIKKTQNLHSDNALPGSSLGQEGHWTQELLLENLGVASEL